MNTTEFISYLECAWELDGFLGKLRDGQFSAEQGIAFLFVLNNVQISETEMVPKRLLELIWYIPSFLEWQNDRIIADGGKSEDYEQFKTKVFNTLENVIGVP